MKRGRVSDKIISCRTTKWARPGNKKHHPATRWVVLGLLLLFAPTFRGPTGSGMAAAATQDGEAESIVVGEATYVQPYRLRYGTTVGDVLLEFAARGMALDPVVGANPPSIHLVDWLLDLGNAHFDDAEYGVLMDSYENPLGFQHANHPKEYHLQLSLQALDRAESILSELSGGEENFLDAYRSASSEGNPKEDRDKMIQLQYYAILQYSKGESYTIQANAAVDDNLSSGEGTNFEKALACYRNSQTAYEKLRYIYAKLSAAASTEKANSDPDAGIYFNPERYNVIESGYAQSCFQLGMSLYSELIRSENSMILQANEKVMELVNQFGSQADAGEDELVEALLGQLGGSGGGAAAASGSGATVFNLNLDDLESLGGLGSDPQARDAHLVEAANFMDTAILTYQQHANPARTDPKNEMKVYLNGVPRKSKQQLEEEDRLFGWRSSLAMAYENAATIATTRNQLIRSRELMNHALRLYVDVIIPYYDDRDKRPSQDARRSIRKQKNIMDVVAQSAMTREYAQVSVAGLYVSLSTVSTKLGRYEDAKDLYSKGMDCHMQYKVQAAPDGLFNSLMGDEVSLRQYQDFATTYRQELDQYRENVKTGYVYRDDRYELEVLFQIASLYMSMGKSDPAIRCYKEAIGVVKRKLGDDGEVNESNRSSFVSLLSAQVGMSGAYFHGSLFAESKEVFVWACEIYQKIYGEGNPPESETEAYLEDMKDTIIESYGEDYYEQLKAAYDTQGIGVVDGGKSTVIGGGDGDTLKVATNFDVLGYHNDTLEDDNDYVDDDEMDDSETFSNDEL